MLGVASFFNGHSPSFARFDFVSSRSAACFMGWMSDSVHMSTGIHFMGY